MTIHANLFDLTSRAAIETGSAQGVGRAMALALTEADAGVVLLDRDAAGIETTAHTIRQLARKALPIPRDEAGTEHTDRVFAVGGREFGRLDCWPRSWSGMRYGMKR